MTIRFACRCGKKMKTSDDKIGKKILCSACGSPVVVPSGDTVAVEKVIAPASSSAAAADTASALLRGTATQDQKKSKRTIAYDDPAMAPEATFDATATAKYVTMGFLLPAVGIVVGVMLLYAFVVWVTGVGDKLPPLAEVTGAVYYDGVPLKGAEIRLYPSSSNGQEKAKASASVGRTDDKGRFRMKYNRDAYGAPIGPCTVVITATGPDGQEISPLRYRDRTETREVVSGSNDFDFQMKSDQEASSQ